MKRKTQTSSDEFFVDLLRSRIDNDKTSANYVARFVALQKRRGFENATIYDIVANPSRYWVGLTREYPNLSSRKSIVTAIMAVFKYHEHLKDTHETAYDEWKQHHGDLELLKQDHAKHNRLTEKQKDAYVSYDEIRTKFLRMKKGGDPHATKQSSLQYLLLAIVVDIPPTRADLGSLMIATEEINRGDINYVVVLPPKQRSYIVLNRYKTSKTYNRTELELNSRTWLVIRDSVRRYPRVYLFTDTKGKPFSNQEYGQFVQRTFKQLFGKTTGVSLLRHIYVSEELDLAHMSDHERERVAAQMMHSPQTQITTYRYLDDTHSGNEQLHDCECSCKKVSSKMM